MPSPVRKRLPRAARWPGDPLQLGEFDDFLRLQFVAIALLAATSSGDSRQLARICAMGGGILDLVEVSQPVRRKFR